MSGFREAVQGAGPVSAPHVITLKPEAFSPTWSQRPRVPMLFGLRLPSESDVQTVRAEAAKQAVNLSDDPQVQVDTFNDAVLALLVSYAICDPANVSAPHPLLQFPQDQVQEALTSSTIRKIFDEVERLQVATSPVFTEISDEEVKRLIELLQGDELTNCGPVTAKRCRRFLGFVLEELTPDG